MISSIFERFDFGIVSNKIRSICVKIMKFGIPDRFLMINLIPIIFVSFLKL